MESEGLRTGDDWVYPEEVFLGFNEVVSGNVRTGSGGGARERGIYDNQKM